MSERSERDTQGSARMSVPTPTWYDLLGVEPSADEETIRAAWRGAIADLDPTERRFATLSEAAAVLLDPARRRAYDAEIAPPEPSPEATDEPEPGPDTVAAPPAQADDAAPSSRPAAASYLVPGWVLATVGVVAVAAVVLAGILAARPAPAKVVQDTAQLVGGSKVTDIEEPAIAAVAAAKLAAVPVVSYDYRSLDEGQRRAEGYLTDSYRKEYDKLFEKLRASITSTQTVITSKVVDSALVRVSDGRADVLLFVDRSTTRKGSATAVPTQDQVTLSMEKVGSRWLVDNLRTDQIPD